MLADPVFLVTHDREWAARFQQRARSLRLALGDTAARIDHVGSTAVPGLDASPILDVQVSVLDGTDPEHYRPALEALGYLWYPLGADRLRQVFHLSHTTLATHLMVCQAGGWAELTTLLFRDYLRAQRKELQAYAAVKREAVHLHANDHAAYRAAKQAFIAACLGRADAWAAAEGWSPGLSNA